MKALVLATSEKNPLAPMERRLPAPMMPLLNRPVMRYSIELLYQYGIRDIYVSLCHSGEKIEQYFENGQRWGINFTYLLQQEPRGSAGAIHRAKYHIDETFIVLPADLLIEVDLYAALNYHRINGKIATMILQSPPSDALHRDRTVSCSRDGSVLTAAEASVMEHQAYCDTGVYIFEPEILKYIPKDEVYECATELIPALLAAQESVAGYVNDGYWNPLDSFGAYQHAQDTLFKRMMVEADEAEINVARHYSHGRQHPVGVWCGKNVQIHPTAHIHPPVCVGQGSQLLPGAEIGPNVVLGSYVVVGNGTSIRDSMVVDTTFVGAYLEIENKIVNKTALIDIKHNDAIQVGDPSILNDVSPAFFSNLLRTMVEKCIAALLIFCAAPIMLLIGLSVLATSGGPMMNVVQRIGPKPEGLLDPSLRGPQIVSLTHFRTRRPDGHYTKMGRWLEQWEFHRLPELWSVLTGELNLVGVEPLSLEESYLVEQEWQLQRYRCKAGFTGFWYTKTTTANSDFIERCVVDVYYAVTRRFSVDILQLLHTPAVWVRRIQSLWGVDRFGKPQDMVPQNIESKI